MNDEQKKWKERFWGNFGPREFIRIWIALVIWSFLGIAINMIFDFPSSVIGSIVVIGIFAFPVVAHWWKPAWKLYRKILGNENLPTEPAPRPSVNWQSKHLKWWHFVIIGWAILMNLILFFLVIKYISK